MKPKITICIPSYNSESTIRETLESCLAQEYPNKEVLVIDDCSKDQTVEIVKKYPVRLILNEKNLGIGANLVKLMNNAKGKYVVYLCADDVFTSNKFLGDVVRQFDQGDPAIGVLGRYFYFFMNGHEGAIGVCRDRNILTQSCCPSGMAFRKIDGVQATNKIFIEMPSLVNHYLTNGWRWGMFEYDVFAARFHPGGNTGTKSSYYVESPLQNWIDLTGDQKFAFHEGFVQLKNRAPHLLIPEIKLAIKMNPDVLKEKRFWVYALVALLLPGWFLRKFTNFYRHRITRRHVQIIPRPENGEIQSTDPAEEGYAKKGIF